MPDEEEGHIDSCSINRQITPMHFSLLTSVTQTALSKRHAIACHLVNFVPFGMEALFDRLALEQLGADLQDAVRVRFAFDQPSQKFIFPFQILSLQKVNPQDSLQRHAEHSVKWGGGGSEIAASDTSRPQWSQWS